MEGLKHKFNVKAIGDLTGKHNECRFFVLDPQHDPSARAAIRAYAADTDNPALRADLLDWLDDLELNPLQRAFNRELDCPCAACDPGNVWTTDDGKRFAVPSRLSVCPTCGNKRCPRANDHNNEVCSNSNDPKHPLNR